MRKCWRNKQRQPIAQTFALSVREAAMALSIMAIEAGVEESINIYQAEIGQDANRRKPKKENQRKGAAKAAASSRNAQQTAYVKRAKRRRINEEAASVIALLSACSA